MRPEFLAYLQAEKENKKKDISISYTGNLDDLFKWVKRKYKRWKRRSEK